MAKKAKEPHLAVKLEHIPNVGPAVTRDLNILGIHQPQDLIGKDPLALYEQLNKVTGQRHDPCMLDVLMSAVSKKYFASMQQNSHRSVL
jgi:hypothetical protein